MTETKPHPERTRRDFVTVAAGSLVGVGGLAAAWPFIDQMNPAAGTAPPETVHVDVAGIRPGEAITVAWRRLPVVIRHRTAAEIEATRRFPIERLRDPLARNDALPANTPATDLNRTHPDHPQWLVVVGLCTHLGCRLLMHDGRESDVGDELFFCPCHAARFDYSGRVRSGPARTNLPVPRFRFAGAARILIG